MGDGDAGQEHLQEFLLTLQRSGVVDDNFKQLLALQDEDNPQFMVEVVEMFLEKSSSLPGEAESCLASSDFASFIQAVHRFKGSSATIGAFRVAETCGLLCQAGRDQNMSTCRSLLTQLSSEMAAVNVYMDAFLKLTKV